MKFFSFFFFFPFFGQTVPGTFTIVCHSGSLQTLSSMLCITPAASCQCPPPVPTANLPSSVITCSSGNPPSLTHVQRCLLHSHLPSLSTTHGSISNIDSSRHLHRHTRLASFFPNLCSTWPSGHCFVTPFFRFMFLPLVSMTHGCW